MRLQKGKPLSKFTSFQIGGKSRLFCEFPDTESIVEKLESVVSETSNLFILGGGSNVLISDAGFDGLTLRINTRGMNFSEKHKETVTVSVEAGEKWDKVVETCISHKLWGIENLSHIPGTAGAAVVQNIGAYGQEIASVISSVEVYDMIEKRCRFFSAGDCAFNYRRSIFNTSAIGRYLILRIHLVLSLIENPQLQYADVERYFNNRKITRPSASEIREGIISIRDSKFPFPDYNSGGNAGSFFKNLKLKETEFEKVIKLIHDRAGKHFSDRLQKSMERSTGAYKTLPTAVLIDALDMKGYSRGGAMINETQPLVIINTGAATAEDVLTVFSAVRREIFRNFGLVIENEPQLVGFSKAEKDVFFTL